MLRSIRPIVTEHGIPDEKSTMHWIEGYAILASKESTSLFI